MALLLASSAFSLTGPWIAGQLTGLALGETKVFFTSINGALVAWLALMSARGLLDFSSAYLVGSTGETMAAQLRTRVYEHLQILPMTYYQEQRPGDLLTLLSNDAQIISNFVTGTLVQLLPLSFAFLGAFIIMAAMDPGIAILAAVLLPAYYLAMKVIGRRIRPITTSWIESWSAMVSLVQENLGLFPAIKAFSREPLEADRFNTRNSDFLTWSRKRILIQSMMSPAIGVLAGAGLILLLRVGFGHLENGELEVSGLVSLLLYAAMLTQPVSGLANVYGQLMWTRGAAERLLEFFAVQSEPLEDNKPPIANVKGKIEYRKYQFRLPRAAESV